MKSRARRQGSNVAEVVVRYLDRPAFDGFLRALVDAGYELIGPDGPRLSPESPVGGRPILLDEDAR